MLLFKLVQNSNKDMVKAYKRYFAYPVVTDTVDLSGLAAHMASHNTGFSPGQVKGILTDMVRCIKELVLNGIAVKIEDLAIFTIGIENKEGSLTKDDFSVAKNIESVKLRARATGEFTRAKLNLEASLANIDKFTKGIADGTPDGGGENTDKPSAGDDSGNQGAGGQGSGSTGTGDAGQEGGGGDLDL